VPDEAVSNKQHDDNMTTTSTDTPVSLTLEGRPQAALEMILAQNLPINGQRAAMRVCLQAAAELIANHAAVENFLVSEVDAEDATPALHVYLWRGHDLCDLPEAVASLDEVADGHWDGGRVYSLTLGGAR
jgi:hypothetical protein